MTSRAPSPLHCPRAFAPVVLAGLEDTVTRDRRAAGWRARRALAGLLLLGALAGPLHAADHVTWKDHRLDAHLEGAPLAEVLDRLGTATGWQVFVEPNTERRVAARFGGLRVGEALERLLGDLNYALIPPKRPAEHGRLFVFRTSVHAATELVSASPKPAPPPPAAKPIPNELIVRLRPGFAVSIEELAKRLGARVVGRADALNAYRLQFDDEAAAQSARAQIAGTDGVESVESNYLVPRPDQPEALGLSAAIVPFNLRPKAVTDASRVVVGLVDTAVQLDGTILKDFTLPQVFAAGDVRLPADQLAHGTAMGETLLVSLAQFPGAAQGTPVRILPVDIYGAGVNTTTFEVAQGIVLAINGGARIVNLSFGGEGHSPLVQSVIQSGREQGVVFVGAAGNEPVTTAVYPAAYPEVIAVTASTRAQSIAPYANRGAFVDVAAPGTSIVPYRDQSFVVVGTSTAAAHVSAVAASIAATSGKTGSALETQVRQALALKPTETKAP